MCRNPYIASKGQAFGCGQCLPCRINRRRVWTHRIMLEASCHGDNSFWTLTYSDENIPLTERGLGTLHRKDLTDFMKRLRKSYQPHKLRYFYVGEYGSQTWRPHYHLALFNYPACARGTTRQNRSGNCCDICDRVRGIWGQGLVHSGQLEDASAAYIAGYVTKKCTSKEDPRLEGRKEEFANMSLRPGIGAGFMPEVASALLSHNLHGRHLTDVPSALRHGRYVRPLGRYLTRHLRTQVGMEPDAPIQTIEAAAKKLRPLQEIARETTPKGVSYKETFKNLIIDTHEGQFKRLEGKSKLHRKRDHL